MESLTVYEDYMHHMSFLRASRNRIMNALDTSNITPAEADIIRAACHTICTRHSQLGLHLVDNLQSACKQRHKRDMQDAMQKLHKYNRQTARLSRLFEEDVNDSHPDPDAPIDENAPKVAYNTKKFISVKIFLTKLQQLVQVTTAQIKT
jgi:hypothetical protein